MPMPRAECVVLCSSVSNDLGVRVGHFALFQFQSREIVVKEPGGPRNRRLDPESLGIWRRRFAGAFCKKVGWFGARKQ